MSSEAVKTAVSWVEPGRVLVRGYRIEELIGRVEWGQAAYLMLVGELPRQKEGELIEAILVASIDHGPTSPAAKAAMTVASTGATLSSALSAGVLAITRYHGGAIEDCMTVLEECVSLSLDSFEAATEIATRFRSRGERIAGFGSRRHPEDPRVKRLLEYAEELELAGPYVRHLRALQRALSETVGRHLPINIDGAIAALLCEIRFPKQAANALFMISRVAGLTAHAIEEQVRNKLLHSADSKTVEYDGPAERKL